MKMIVAFIRFFWQPCENLRMLLAPHSAKAYLYLQKYQFAGGVVPPAQYLSRLSQAILIYSVYFFIGFAAVCLKGRDCYKIVAYFVHGSSSAAFRERAA